MTLQKISVIGAGYVGLTTAACFSDMGHTVFVSDVDTSRIGLLNSGICPIKESGLDELIISNCKSGNLNFVSDNIRAASESDFIFLCLPTPESADGSPDLSYIRQVITEIRDHLRPNAVVVNKSTVPVGSSALTKQLINRTDIHVVSNPEFLKEGSAVFDFLNPDRIVIGSDDSSVCKQVANLYIGCTSKVIISDAASAELVKYASNAFLAMKISFVNSLARLCERSEAKIDQVIEGMGSDPRIGPQFLQPGPGWGGSCFPKDTSALKSFAKSLDYEFDLIESTIESNEKHIEHVSKRILSLPTYKLAPIRVCALGLTFKAGTDDRRESPALKIINSLLNQGAIVNAYDPTVDPTTEAADLSGINLFGSAYAAAEGSHVVVILTEWQELKDLDIAKIRQSMSALNIFDTRNYLELHYWREHGFNISNIGMSHTLSIKH